MEDKKKDRTLLHRYVDNLYTTEEARRLLEECRTGSSDELFNDMSAEIWEESSFHQFETDVEREKYKDEARQLLHRINGNKSKKYYRLWHAVVGVAAVLCLVWGGIYYFRYVADGQITYLTASTSFGEHKKVRLPDGTCLVLNACSQIRYPNRFVGKERRVSLEGEAYFCVTRNEKQAFVVDAPGLDVRVLGTTFNVKSYSSDETAYVDVESGKVQVDMPEAMMRLKANERVIVNRTQGEYSKLCEDCAVATWRNGSLRFASTPIHDVAKELERMYNCRIVFAKGQKFDNIISGEHENKSLEAVLQSIQYTSGIHYSIKENEVLFYKD